MTSSSVFSNRLLRSRSILKKCAGNSQILSSCAVGNASIHDTNQNQRLYHGPISTTSSQQQQAFSTATTTTIARGPLSDSTLPQRRQQRRQRIYFSSSPQESSSMDAESDVPDNNTTSTANARASKPTIDPNEVEIERRKVKDVPIREVLDVSCPKCANSIMRMLELQYSFGFCGSSKLISLVLSFHSNPFE